MFGASREPQTAMTGGLGGVLCIINTVGSGEAVGWALEGPQNGKLVSLETVNGMRFTVSATARRCVRQLERTAPKCGASHSTGRIVVAG